MHFPSRCSSQILEHRFLLLLRPCDTFEPVAIRSSLVLCDTFEPVAIRFKLGVVRYVSACCDTFQAWCCAIRFSLLRYVSSLVLCDTFHPVAIRSSLVLCDTFQPVAIRFKLGVVRYIWACCDTFQAWCCAIRFSLVLGICLSLLRYTFQAWCYAIRFSLVLAISFSLVLSLLQYISSLVLNLLAPAQFRMCACMYSLPCPAMYMFVHPCNTLCCNCVHSPPGIVPLY